jgi:hypothetical protein
VVDKDEERKGGKKEKRERRRKGGRSITAARVRVKAQSASSNSSCQLAESSQRCHLSGVMTDFVLRLSHGLKALKMRL